jgi:phage gpG-like protein
MRLNELEGRLKDLLRNYKEFAENEAPEIVGRMAQEHYKESFENEGFTDSSLKKWPDVQRRINPRRPDRASATRNILVNTGNLRRSVDYQTYKGRVVVSAEAFSKTGFNYALVHNWGANKIPQRQFLGDSHTLNQKILDRLKEKVSQINKDL